MEETKSLKISPKVHKKVKMHTAATDQNINDFAEKALLGQIRMEKLAKKILKSDTNEQ